MSTGHAAGVRLPYAAGPAALHRWVERELGSSVVETIDCTGGMSPGPAARVLGSNGRRAFVKACGTALNPDTPTLLRAEIACLTALPAHPSIPRLDATLDDGDWVALLLEDVPVPLAPIPWSRDHLDRVSETLTELGSILQPCPWPEAPVASQRSGGFFSRWRILADDPPDDLAPWWRAHLDGLAPHAARAIGLVDGNALAHWDVRSDNVLIGDDRVVLVDWGQSRRAVPWMDHLLLAMDTATSGAEIRTMDYLRSEPALRDVDLADVLAILAAVALALRQRVHEPDVPSLPTLGATSERWSSGLVPFLDEALRLV